MSIDYTLYLTRTHPPDLTHREHVWSAQGPVGEPTATYKEEDFGIRPTVSVLLRPDKWHQDEARAELASLVGEILRQTDDDALLLANGELPVLRRTAGRVVVSSRSAWAIYEELDGFGLAVAVEDLGDVV